MRVTKKDLKHLPFRGYIINETITVNKTISRHIPVTTGVEGLGFPAYLRGFEEYYECLPNTCWYSLKNEYQFNRPEYTCEISYKLYDITVTDVGKDYVDSTIKRLQKRINDYQKLLG